MGVLGEGPDGLDPWIGRRIGRIDDAERRFAARHEQQRGAHALCRRDGGPHTVPDPELFEGGLAVLARRNRVGVGHREMPAFEHRRQIEARFDLDMRIAVGRRDQNEPVAEQVAPARALDQMPLVQVIHPVEIRRYEHVGRRAAFDLLGQRRARRIRNFAMGATLPLEQLGGFVERIGEASGREYDHILRARRLPRAERDQRDGERGGKSPRFVTGYSLVGSTYPARYRDNPS